MIRIKKRRHHYVWQHYLDAWSTQGKLFCLQQGRIFEAGTGQVAVKKDFYRPQKLSSAELDFIRQVAFQSADSKAAQYGESTIRFLTWPATAAEVLERRGAQGADPLVVALQDFEENYHAHVEGSAVVHLRALRQRNADFLADDREHEDFLHFLFLQFFRTAKWQETISASLRHVPGVDLARSWRVLRYLLADNCASTICAKRHAWRVTFLAADSAARFITSDQPAFNTVRPIDAPGHSPTELTLYYPVSPTTAILLSEREEASNGEVLEIGASECGRYNRLMAETAFRQTYASSEEDLRRFLPR